LRRQHKVACPLGLRVNVCCDRGAQACAEGSDSFKAAMTPRDRFTGVNMSPPVLSCPLCALMSPVCSGACCCNLDQAGAAHDADNARVSLSPCGAPVPRGDSVLFIGTQFSNLYTAVDMSARAA
jgi:hypothetical protein